MRALAPTALVALLVACGPAPADPPDAGDVDAGPVGPDAGESVEAGDPIDTLVAPWVEDRWVPGMVVAIARGEAEVEYRSYGTFGPGDDRVPDADTFFEIGSLTKGFTGALLGEMVARGEVALTDEAQAYVPEGVTVPSRGGVAITLGQLATHTSALPRMPGNLVDASGADPYAGYDAARLWSWLGAYRLEWNPGEYYLYSNVGIGLLGELLARKAGVTYRALLQARILDPLELADTRFELDEEDLARTAPPHVPEGLAPANFWRFDVMAPTGVLKSTARDLVKYGRAVLAASEGDEGAAAGLALATRRAFAVSGNESAGLGWRLSTDGRVMFHDGGTTGYLTRIVIDRAQDLVVVVLTNAGSPWLSLTEAITDEVRGVPYVRPKAHREVAPETGEFDAYVGSYRLGRRFTCVVTREGDVLYAQLTGQPRYRMRQRARDSFFTRAATDELDFDRNAAGEVVGMSYYLAGAALVGARVAGE